MKRSISFAALIVFASVCTSAPAYNVTFVSQTITRTMESEFYGYTLSDVTECLSHGADATFTNSNSSKTATFGIDAQVFAASWNDYGFTDPVPPGYGTFLPEANWTLKTKFKWSPTYSGETPSQGLLVKYDVKTLGYSSSSCEYSDGRPNTGGTIETYGMATLYDLFPSLTSGASVTLVNPMQQNSDGQTVGSTSYHDAGNDVLTGITFALVDGEWIGEAVSYVMAEGELGCLLATTASLYGPWYAQTQMQIKYQYKPIMVGAVPV